MRVLRARACRFNDQEDYGVVPGQFPALLALYERDEQTQRELCEVASVDQSTMAKTLAG